VLLRSDLDVGIWFVEHLGRTQAPLQSVAKFIAIFVTNLVTPKPAAMFKLSFVNQKFELMCSFRCDQAKYNHCFEFGHTLLCFLSAT
jgi:hypothetical protein